LSQKMATGGQKKSQYIKGPIHLGMIIDIMQLK
jgi:hypothetical protein